MAICPNCGNQTGEGAVFCDQCGTRLPAPEVAVPEPAPAPAAGSVICPACGAGNVPGEAFCDYCGSPLEAPVPTAEVVPDLEPISSEAELEVVPEPAPSVEEPVPPAEEPVPSEADKPTCPACGAEVLPGEAFCANCGASLAQPPIPPEPVPEIEPEPVAEEAAPEPVVEEAVPEPVVEEPVAEPSVEAAPPPSPAPAEVRACPACGAEVEPGDAFCSACGFALKAAPEAAPAEEEPVPVPPPATGPRLVVAASGAEIPLPAGPEILIGREDPVSGVYPDVDLTPHGGEDGGVSRRHARLVVEGGQYFVEDLDSTNFTFVNKTKIAPKSRHSLSDGDEIRCGRVALILRQ
jgi:pSer/pThr/pTyr-binding forkhead associated (FHA) protein